MIRTSFLFLIACSTLPSPQLARTTSRLTVAEACINPASYGALPDDGVSDRVAFQTAVDVACAQPEGGTVCVGAGVWNGDRAPDGNYNNKAVISSHCARPITITGAGPETVLLLAGDQGKKGVAWLSVDPSSQNFRIERLTLRLRATNTDEQTHAIVSSGICNPALLTCLPIRNLSIDNVTFDWGRVNDADRSGDCFRALGNTAPTPVSPGTELYGASITDTRGDCSRSFVSIQRGVHQLRIANNTIACSRCDQLIDGEATGVVGLVGAPTEVVISGNTLTRGPSAQGDFNIALTSVQGAAISGNTLTNGGIALYRSAHVAISGGSISAPAMTGDYGVIDAQNLCDGLTISGVTVTRGGHVGPLIALAPHSGAYCTGVAISGNTLTQGTAFHGIFVTGLSRSVISGNVITHAIPAPAFSGILVSSLNAGASLGALVISNNVISGAPTRAITLHASPGGFGVGISVTGNVATGTTFGMVCENGGLFTAPVVSSGNSWPPGASIGVTVAAGT